MLIKLNQDYWLSFLFHIYIYDSMILFPLTIRKGLVAISIATLLSFILAVSNNSAHYELLLLLHIVLPLTTGIASITFF
jgi:hypothetical protein